MDRDVYFIDNGDYVNESTSAYDANQDFTSLNAWRKTRKVKLFFYDSILVQLPKEEKYDLGSQIRKAAISVTANISEGYGRFHYQEGIQFYRVSRGSLYELKDHLISCYDLNYVNKQVLNDGLELIEATKKILNGYIRFVKKQKSMKG
jgi:four helix bundle protein